MRFSADSGPLRRPLALIVVIAVLGGLAAGLSQGLTSCSGTDSGGRARPLTIAEARRLAVMRLRNFRDGRTGLRGRIGPPGNHLRLSGWVDWTQPLAYLAVAPPARRPATSPAAPSSGTAPSTEPVDGLVQAVPGVVATRVGHGGRVPG